MSAASTLDDPLLSLASVPRRIPRIDVAIAGGLLVWALLEALFAEGPGSTAARIAFAIGFTAPLLVRRRHPAAVLITIFALSALRGATGDVPEEGAMPVAPLLVAAFSAALYARPKALAYACLPVPMLAFATAVALDSWAGDPTAVDVAILSFFSAGAWTAGWLVRRRAEQAAEARAQAPLLAQEAVGAERARLARELHDVVAHSVSVISVQAGAAEALIDADPAKAREHISAVRQTAHEALVELRRLVGVLREDEAPYAPQPGLWRLDELLEEARRAGLQAQLSEEGPRPALPPGVDLAAYRIVQEALTNVRRHAGSAPARVVLRYWPDAVELEVLNEPGTGGDGPGSGHGLIGMQERARLYGGTVDAGPREDGGFAVRATLPIEAGQA